MSGDLQTVHCPGCGKPLEVAPGSHLACPYCGQRILIETAPPPRVEIRTPPRMEMARADTGFTLDAIRQLLMAGVASVIIVGGIWGLVSPNDPLAQIAGMFALISLYLAPAISAILSRHPYAGPIGLINLLLGWTFLGWVVAAIWAIAVPRRST